jgi:lipopolysaccharide export system ATP-binding protein|tara:strand:- start:5315 stop:6091 length:777 start_codon:yes stop_codon:yes gene_type:complete
MAIIKKFRLKSFKKNKPLLEFRNVSLSFGNTQILDNVSFKVNSGEICGLLGPNGSGKSTIFNLITGLLKPDFGEIYINNTSTTEIPIYLRSRKFKIGYCPQSYGYWSDLTLLDNLRAVSEILIEDKKSRVSKIDYLISKFELDAAKHTKANFLSGGQKKRLTLAMALLGSPKILLLDEPFSALDPITIHMLQEIIANLQTEFGISSFISDHQASELLRIVDIAHVISNTKIVTSGTPSEIVRNNKARAAYFGEFFKMN